MLWCQIREDTKKYSQQKRQGIPALLLLLKLSLDIDAAEEPTCVIKEGTAGAVSVLIIARTPEEAERLFDQHKIQ